MARGGLPHCTLEHPLNVILGYDPVTLREKVDLRAAGERLAELGALRSLNALNEKVGLLRMVGRLDEALEIANEAVRRARFTGNRDDVLSARLRRAQVLQYQGGHHEALGELTVCVDEARANGWKRLEAYALQHRAKVLFDQREFEAALTDARAAVQLREELAAPTDQLESSLIAVAVIESFLDEEQAAG